MQFLRLWFNSGLLREAERLWVVVELGHPQSLWPVLQMWRKKKTLSTAQDWALQGGIVGCGDPQDSVQLAFCAPWTRRSAEHPLVPHWGETWARSAQELPGGARLNLWVWRASSAGWPWAHQLTAGPGLPTWSCPSRDGCGSCILMLRAGAGQEGLPCSLPSWISLWSYVKEWESSCYLEWAAKV